MQLKNTLDTVNTFEYSNIFILMNTRHNTYMYPKMFIGN